MRAAELEHGAMFKTDVFSNRDQDHSIDHPWYPGTHTVTSGGESRLV